MTSGLEDSRLLVYLFSHIYRYNTVPVKPSRGFFFSRSSQENAKMYHVIHGGYYEVPPSSLSEIKELCSLTIGCTKCKQSSDASSIWDCLSDKKLLQKGYSPFPGLPVSSN